MTHRCPICDGYLHLADHSSCRRRELELRLPVVCPQCRGSGSIVTAWRDEFRCCKGASSCNYCPHGTTEKVPTETKRCELCEGVGRLEKEPTPITETITKGWKR